MELHFQMIMIIIVVIQVHEVRDLLIVSVTQSCYPKSCLGIFVNAMANFLVGVWVLLVVTVWRHESFGV